MTDARANAVRTGDPGSTRRVIPHPPLLWRAFRSGLLVWIVVRAAYVLVLFSGTAVTGLFTSADAAEFARRPAPVARLLLLLITVVLVHIDRTRAHERLLPSNLGISWVWFSGAALGGAAVSDVLLQLLLRSW